MSRGRRAHEIQIVTLGQYLRPSPEHPPMARYVEAGLLVRGSYYAGEHAAGGLRISG